MLVGRYEACAELEDGDEEEVEDEGPFSSVAVRDYTEDDGADGAEEEGEGDRGRLGCGWVSMLGVRTTAGREDVRWYVYFC